MTEIIYDERADHIDTMAKQGKEIEKLKELLKECKGSIATLSRQEALNRALKGRKNIRNYKGKSLLQWCKETGVRYKTAYSRLKQGYSIKEAIDENLKQRRYLVDGKPMRQVLGAKKAQQVYRRMNEGWSFEDAVRVPTVDPVESGKAGYYMARKLGYL